MDISLVLQIPEDLYFDVKNVSEHFGSSVETDIIRLLERYVHAYDELVIDSFVDSLLYKE